MIDLLKEKLLGLKNSTEHAHHAENPNADHSTAEEPVCVRGLKWSDKIFIAYFKIKLKN